MTAGQFSGLAMLVIFAIAWIALSMRSPPAKAALLGVLWGSAVFVYIAFSIWLIAGGAP